VLAGDAAPGADGGLVTIDLDATIVIAHSATDRRKIEVNEPSGRQGGHPMSCRNG
jgi:hypothetical protein